MVVVLLLIVPLLGNNTVLIGLIGTQWSENTEHYEKKEFASLRRWKKQKENLFVNGIFFRKPEYFVGLMSQFF